jgi:D,D-heptose 1,7-bisphosphate phosphatase
MKEAAVSLNAKNNFNSHIIKELKKSDDSGSKKPAIFLDRDGVINTEVNYLTNPDDFEFIDGSIKALKILKKKGYLLIVITNQAGIARGYFSEMTLNKIHDKMMKILQKNNIFLDDIFYCPHHPDFTGACNCRKPSPGLILQAMKKYNIDLEKSYMIGDTLNDIATGKNVPCKTVLVLTGYGKEAQKKISNIKPDKIYLNLLEFAKNI